MKKLLRRFRNSRAAALPEYALVFSVMAAGMVGTFQMLEDRGGDVVDHDASAIGRRPQVESLYDAQVAAGVLATAPASTTPATAPPTTSPATTTPATTTPPTLIAQISLTDLSYNVASNKRQPRIKFEFRDALGNQLEDASVTFQIPKTYAADGYRTTTKNTGSDGDITLYTPDWYYNWEFPFNVGVLSVVDSSGNNLPLSGSYFITLYF